MFSRLPQYEQTTNPWSRLIRTVFLTVFTVARRLARTAWERRHNSSLISGSCCPSETWGGVHADANTDEQQHIARWQPEHRLYHQIARRAGVDQLQPSESQTHDGNRLAQQVDAVGRHEAHQHLIQPVKPSMEPQIKVASEHGIS